MTTSEQFMEVWDRIAERVHNNAINKGFAVDGEHRNHGMMIALIHSEISECLEAVRKDNPRSEKIPDFSNAEEELADTVIRIMDYARENDWDVATAIAAKMEFNENRPHKHGKAF